LAGGGPHPLTGINRLSDIRELDVGHPLDETSRTIFQRCHHRFVRRLISEVEPVWSVAELAHQSAS